MAVSKDDLGSGFADERLKLRLGRLARRWAGRTLRTVRGTGVENLHLLEPMLRLGEPVANELELAKELAEVTRWDRGSGVRAGDGAIAGGNRRRSGGTVGLSGGAHQRTDGAGGGAGGAGSS
jgi:hypothetical protein